MQNTATLCNTLQHTATHIPVAPMCRALSLTPSALQHTATLCNILQHSATPCNTNTCCTDVSCVILNTFRAATHCYTQQHTATHCNTLQHSATHIPVAQTFRALSLTSSALQHTATYCKTLQQTATHCNTLQHTATRRCNILPHTVTHIPFAPKFRALSLTFVLLALQSPTMVRCTVYVSECVCVFVCVWGGGGGRWGGAGVVGGGGGGGGSVYTILPFYQYCMGVLAIQDGRGKHYIAQ